ncbi:MAG TPA: hypothetical protein IGS52_23720 [Oscillatoriaceae cyanobacterium M33_DOE_052]|uniref:Uncharacterized protein n=1 Tax=Planktothricoides sp. SpSt-374 TaxID=2282167 RepID=A0A7C3ZJC3_9CYAN|nr:hypothetical protein [Oscillatoriaceae cyanobacterium M33_DOE_052]
MEKIAPLTSLRKRLGDLGNYHPLDFAEYGAIAASAAGAIAASLFKEILFAATPVTVALALNVINRNRVELQTRLQQAATIAELHEMVEYLQASVEDTTATRGSLSELQATVERQAEAISDLQNYFERTSPQSGTFDAAAVQREFAVVRRAIVRLRDQNEASLNDIQQRLIGEVQLIRQIASHPSSGVDSAATFGDLANLVGDYTQLQNQIQSLSQKTLPELAQVQTQVNQLQERLNKLQQQNREIVKPYLQRLASAVKRLEGKDH